MTSAWRFRVLALIAAYNEEDVIGAVLSDLIEQGVEAYLIDHGSDDDTVAEAARFLGRGLVHIERFPQDCGGPAEDADRFVWGNLLRRKSVLASQLDADWFIHWDADELRDSPWRDKSLRDAIELVDRIGYNSIDFGVFNFIPTHDSYRRGDDLRAAFTHYLPGAEYDAVQIRAWKKLDHPVELAHTGGHEAQFDGRKVFPLKFLLRHYPIRTEAQGRKKIFRDRRPRFVEEERRRRWHIQYDDVVEGQRFVRDPRELIPFDPDVARVQLALRHRGVEELTVELARQQRELEHARNEASATIRERDRLRQDFADAQARVAALYRSRSWRWTAPARLGWRWLGRS
jgi:hypothetical protein